MTGDLSLVTKIGRRGDKCEVLFYNLDLTGLHLIKPMQSVAWSFTLDSPETRKIPIRISPKSEDISNAEKDYSNNQVQNKSI